MGINGLGRPYRVRVCTQRRPHGVSNTRAPTLGGWARESQVVVTPRDQPRHAVQRPVIRRARKFADDAARLLGECLGALLHARNALVAFHHRQNLRERHVIVVPLAQDDFHAAALLAGCPLQRVHQRQRHFAFAQVVCPPACPARSESSIRIRFW